MSTPVIGRFAPSPTGPLHFGSLVAALASYLSAKSQNGLWLVRMEDLDPPREEPGAADNILRTLEAYGLKWDGPVMYQSTRAGAYEDALARLNENGLTYYCTCSRRDIEEINQEQAHPRRYPGTCRSQTHSVADSAIRVLTDDSTISFTDLLQGNIKQNVNAETGDFILKRRDGLYAYHLAVVVDDIDQRVTEIVRGCDLLDSTPPQMYLYGLLNHAVPKYFHIPTVVNKNGQKLSKQNLAKALDINNAKATLFRGLAYLGVPPPETIGDMTIEELIHWGVNAWQPEKLPKKNKIVWSEGE